jgi:hypothetical protein
MNNLAAPSLATRWERLISALLGLAILLLPITSLPALSRALGKTLVAPPALVLVILAAAMWFPLFLARRGKLPRETLPLLAFAISALVSALLAFFRVIPSFRKFSVTSAETSALTTLAVGVVFYLMFAIWFQEQKRLAWAVRLVSLGGGLVLAWSMVQLFFMKFAGANYPGLVVKFHALLSVRPLTDHTFYNRLTGFAYEPSWLAHQLNVLYLPLWLAASLTGYSAFRKIGRISVENILLAFGVIVLFFSQSRVGLLAFLLVLAYLVYWVNLRLINWLQRRSRLSRLPSRPARIALILLLFTIYTLFAVSLVLILARLDHRFAALVAALSSAPASLLDFAHEADFVQRLVYWVNGWVLFARFPLFGIGPGNAGFFLRENLPPLSERLAEITRVLYKLNNLPNVKSLWARILGETGLAGFSLFVSWFYVLWHAGRFMKTRMTLQLRTLGWMAALVIIVFLAEGFSVDSFAMPYLWVSLGLVTAASALARQGQAVSPSGNPVENSNPS